MLAGRMTALLEVASLRPRQIWYEEDSASQGLLLWEKAIAMHETETLLRINLGYFHYLHFDDMSRRGVIFRTRF